MFMKRVACIALVLAFVCAWSCLCPVQAQSGRPDDSRTSPNPSNGPSRRKSPGRRAVPQRESHGANAKRDLEKNRFARLTIIVSPTDSSALLDGQRTLQIDSTTGVFTVTDLLPGPHTLFIRHDGYRDTQSTFDLKSGDNPAMTITLEPLTGTLSVRPSVVGSSIEVRSTEPAHRIGYFDGVIDRIDLPPGAYEIKISKPGYRSATRSFNITAGGLVDLEPRLELLPPPAPARATVIAPHYTVNNDGKYFVVKIIGTSGDSTQMMGTVNVTINRGTAKAYIQGALSGLPCRVNFVGLENVAETSLIEGPSPSNMWSLIAVRVRPKDPKRLINFAINWTALKD